MHTVLLTVDALRADHLPDYGYDRETMPVLDRLQEGAGTRYESAFANGTYTGISLPSMLTSRYFGQEAASRGPTLATELRDAGVATAGFHSNAMLANAVGEVAGFDRFEAFGVLEEHTDESEATSTDRAYDALVDTLRPLTERLGVREHAERIQEALFPASMIHEPSVYTDAEATTDAALAWLDDAVLGGAADAVGSAEGPDHGGPDDFFLWIHFMDPHRPYGIDLEDPAFADEPADEDEIHELMSKAGIHPDRVTADERRRIVDLYDSDLRYTSDAIGRFLDGLVERDLWNDSAIFLTADHGEEFGDHGCYFHRNHPYDELLRVPLYAKPPRDLSGEPADALHGHTEGVVMGTRELLDVAPTICRLHGVDPPDVFLGTPLGEGVERRVIATGSFEAPGHAVAARWDGWKYIYLEDAGEELYDLTHDAGEQENHADDEPSRCQAYRGEIPEYVLEGDAGGAGDAGGMGDVDDDVVEERLRKLGYME